ncbi:unnamed protein product [Protopolystoma xenopodis]|uniref:Uncharacterized protein n=1 Tax=Protopolystoma xenopodis TaxID=117903 RepID=A0A3S5CVW0_9PLAT|nr:unnamed protein product [Protopolystoma xenopodis]
MLERLVVSFDKSACKGSIDALFCSDDIRRMTDESLAPFDRNLRKLPRKQRQQKCPVRPIDSRSRGLHRLLVESTFKSLHQTLLLEMEVSSTIKMVSRGIVYIRQQTTVRFVEDYVCLLRRCLSDDQRKLGMDSSVSQAVNRGRICTVQQSLLP